MNERNPSWAEPINDEEVPNLHRVSDYLYRSAQPTRIGIYGMRERYGVKTVVNLRSFHHDPEVPGVKNVNIDCKAWHPETEDVLQFLEIMKGAVAEGPVLVHCQHGADRTGLMCAAYRVLVQGWDAEEAVYELISGGFGFHEIWIGIPSYLRNME